MTDTLFGDINCRKNCRYVSFYQEKMTNRKRDMANKIVARLNEYDVVVIQDEQLPLWHKGGHGKAYSTLYCEL